MKIAFKKETPNRGGALINPTLIVIHWTGDNSFDGAVSWLCNPQAKASAHLVIDRSGQVAQLVPFDRVAWHAGASDWEGHSGCNAFSIGIELVNAGELMPNGAGTFTSGLGRLIPKDQAVQSGGKWFHAFTTLQLDAAAAVVSELLASHPSIRDIAGHFDIAPGRKADPGPTFPLAKFRALLEGRQ